MEKSRFSEEQIIAVLREQEGGTKTADAAGRVVQHRPDGHHTNPGLQL